MRQRRHGRWTHEEGRLALKPEDISLDIDAGDIAQNPRPEHDPSDDLAVAIERDEVGGGGRVEGPGLGRQGLLRGEREVVRGEDFFEAGDVFGELNVWFTC